ncbi:hypothetical protein, partial [Sodalis praecaptivus]|uniref:hypothetical protein n=1 Tax=Sodalis praecaptivus TaxID=1239307 RepID=UPI00280BF89A
SRKLVLSITPAHQPNVEFLKIFFWYNSLPVVQHHHPYFKSPISISDSAIACGIFSGSTLHPFNFSPKQKGLQ